MNNPYQRAREKLTEGGGGITAIVDDHYLMAKPPLAFSVFQTLKADLQSTCGLEIQPRKSAAYIDEQFRDEDFEARRVAESQPASPIASSLTRKESQSSSMGDRCEELRSATYQLGQRDSSRLTSDGNRLVSSVTTI